MEQQLLRLIDTDLLIRKAISKKEKLLECDGSKRNQINILDRVIARLRTYYREQIRALNENYQK